MYVAGVKHLDKVLESRWNKQKQEMGILDPAVEKEAERRYAICLSCPYMSENAKSSTEYKALYGQSYTTTRSADDLHCGICLCPLEYKTMSMESMCGLQEWNNRNPTQYIQPKWMVYTPSK